MCCRLDDAAGHQQNATEIEIEIETAAGGADDSLDAFGVHGVCGIWGALATGLFANPAVNEAGRGLFYGNPKQLWIQIISIVATAVFTAVGTIILIYITRLITGGLRVATESEIEGLDSALHGERGFEII